MVALAHLSILEFEAVGEEQVLHFAEVLILLHVELVLEWHLDGSRGDETITLVFLWPPLSH